MLVTSHILPTKDIPPQVLSQIKANSPWPGLRTKLGTADNSDNRVNFAHAGTSGYLLDEENKLVSYGVIGQDELFNANMAEYMGLQKETTIALKYLFTVPTYQKQGYAKQLFDLFLEHIDMSYVDVKYLIWECKSEHKALYTRYGGQLVETSGTNDFLASEGIVPGNYFAFTL